MGELPTQAWEGSYNILYLAVRLYKMYAPPMRKMVSSTHLLDAKRVTLGWGHGPNRRFCEAESETALSVLQTSTLSSSCIQTFTLSISLACCPLCSPLGCLGYLSVTMLMYHPFLQEPAPAHCCG